MEKGLIEKLNKLWVFKYKPQIGKSWEEMDKNGELVFRRINL